MIKRGLGALALALALAGGGGGGGGGALDGAVRNLAPDLIVREWL